MTKDRAAAGFILSLMGFVGVIAWCVWWVPAPFRWVVTAYAFGVCPTILIILSAIQTRRVRRESLDVLDDMAPLKRHNNRGFQLHIVDNTAERGGRKFA